MRDHAARSDDTDHHDETHEAPGTRATPRRPRPGGALLTLATLGLVVAVSIGVAAVGRGQDDSIRLARTAAGAHATG